MIEDEDIEYTLNTLAEDTEEQIGTISEQEEEEISTINEDIYTIGVESLNGKAGHLTLKNINGTDLVGEGNLSLATSSELQSEAQARQQADSQLQTAVDGKQAQLTDAQLAAVNSGIDSTKVTQIATNKTDIAGLQTSKQDKLNQTQLNAVNSGIDATKVGQIAANTEDITSNTERITTIEGKIPSAASSSNKLTDKNYVDNAIATNTANYISDDGEPFQSLADLEAYSGPLTNNDYAFVVSTDASGNLLYTRYKYNAGQEQWAEEYTISNPTFSSTQWAAIDSGVTANDVAQIATNKTDIASLGANKQDKLTSAQQAAVDSGIDSTKVGQITANADAITGLQNSKQDTLTAGTNIQINGSTISATDTTYSAGTGLSLDGTTFSADTSVLATKTELEDKADKSDTYTKAEVNAGTDNLGVPGGFFTNTTATQEGEGTAITINGSGDSLIAEARLKGDTFQQTYTGKNLCPLETYDASVGRNAGYNADIPAGSCTVSFDLTSFEMGTNTSFNINMQFRDADNTIIADPAVVKIDASTSLGRKSYNFTLSTAASSLYQGNIRIAQTQYTNGARAVITNIQIETGSTPTAYEPYVGGIPSPNPDYPQDIQVVTGEQTVKVYGKNLWNNSQVVAESDYVIPTPTGVRITRTTNGRISPEYSIPLTADTTYTISCSLTHTTTNASMLCQWYYEDNTSTYSPVISDGSTTFTPTKNIRGVKFYVSNTQEYGSYVEINDLQIEVGSTDTAYKPYQANQTYTIDLGSIELCKIGNYQDYIWKDGADWKIHKEVGKAVFDGSEAVTGYNTQNNIYGVRLPVDNMVAHNSTVYCDRLRYVIFSEFTGSSTRSVGTITTHDTTDVSTLYASAPNSSITGTADYKTWLSTYNPAVYYALATPTDTVITDSALIEQLNALAQARSYSPQTNITITAPEPNLPAIAWLKVYNDNLNGIEEELANTDSVAQTAQNEVARKADIEFALNQGMVVPVFDGLTPVKTFEWTVTDTTYRPIYQIENTGWDYINMDIRVAYRITVEATGIKQVVDVMDRWINPINYPLTSLMTKTISTSASTTGFRNLRAVYPLAAGLNNTSYKLGQEVNQYNNTSRQYRVEVFIDSPQVTWSTSKPSGSIYTSSTYQTNQSMDPYNRRGWMLRKPASFTATAADQASYVTSYEVSTIGSGAIKSGASALASNHLAFQADDGLVYDISDTTKNMIPNENERIGLITTSVNANTAIGSTYFRSAYVLGSTPTGNIPHATIALGDQIYLRCTMDANGKIHSDNYLATEMSPGYTWLPFGAAVANDSIYMDVRKASFYTLDANGKLTHINGLQIAGGA